VKQNCSGSTLGSFTHWWLGLSAANPQKTAAWRITSFNPSHPELAKLGTADISIAHPDRHHDSDQAAHLVPGQRASKAYARIGCTTSPWTSVSR